VEEGGGGGGGESDLGAVALICDAYKTKAKRHREGEEGYWD
jgi:hypothetical protein